MEKRLLSLQEVQEIENDILVKFADFCEVHNLQYFLCGGTLLGAVRHQGFIPWDDDIDVSMPRPDYEEFLSLWVAEKTQCGNLILETLENKKTDGPFAKLAKVGTLTIENESEDEGMIGIDIFPMDGLPDSSIKRKYLFKIVKIINRLGRLSKFNVHKGSKLQFIKNLLYPFVKRKPIQYYSHLVQKMSIMNDYQGAKYIGGVVNGYGVKETMEKCKVFPPLYMNFCNREFPVYHCYNTYLSNLYGNYMELPPEEERENHNMQCYLVENCCEGNKC